MCYCGVLNCAIRHGQMFSIPKDPELQKLWLIACRRNNGEMRNVTKIRVCRRHFKEECILQHPTKTKIMLKLKKGSVPTLHLDLPKVVTKRVFNYWSQVDKLKDGPPNKLPCTGIPSYQDLMRAACTTDSDNDEESQGNLKSKSCQTQLSLAKSQDFLRLKEINVHLQKQLQDQTDQIKMLQREVIKLKPAKQALDLLFTPGQVKRLLHPKINKTKWSTQDIAAAVALRTKSGKIYNYLREKANFPLPCESTLRNWISGFDVKPGILTDVLKMMEEKGASMTRAHRLTIISFDEIPISNKLDANDKNDRLVGPDEKCFVVMARGLFANWKQPVFYNFEKSFSKDILDKVISSLYDIGYNVVGATSNMHPSSISLWNCTSNFFVHPRMAKRKVYIFADVPQLLKLLRNHFLASGFVVNGKHLTKTFFEELLQLYSKGHLAELKLKEHHLNAKDFQSQRVKFAAELFSWSNAKSIEWCGAEGLLQSPDWEEMANMVELINNWFDLLNSSVKININKETCAYGIDLQKQDKILDEMSEFIQSVRVYDKKTESEKPYLCPFQKGILLTNKSLKDLLDYVKSEFSNASFQPSYILTRRLCQDVVEDFFSLIRSMGERKHQPTSKEFQQRLKRALLSNYSQAFFRKQSAETDAKEFESLAEIDEDMWEEMTAATKQCEESECGEKQPMFFSTTKAFQRKVRQT